MHLPPGLYESLVTDEIAAALAELPTDVAEQRALSPAEAADRIALCTRNYPRHCAVRDGAVNPIAAVISGVGGWWT